MKILILISFKVGVLKNIITSDKEAQLRIAQNVQAFRNSAQSYRDIFLPRSEQKWNKVSSLNHFQSL